MPIFRIKDQLHYFAHVPKCGGVSVEAYLTARFGPMALREPDRWRLPESEWWGKSSGEHIPAAALFRLVPRDWLVSSFTVVRHPVSRFLSAFMFNRERDRDRRIPIATDINVWTRDNADLIARDPYIFGSHFRTQTSVVPEDAQVFRFEAGLDQIVPYLDALAGNSDGPRHVPARNVGNWRANEDAPTLTPATLVHISRLYAADFDRFGYPPPDAAAPAATFATLPARTATGRPPDLVRYSLLTRFSRSLRRRAGL